MLGIVIHGSAVALMTWGLLRPKTLSLDLTLIYCAGIFANGWAFLKHIL